MFGEWRYSSKDFWEWTIELRDKYKALKKQFIAHILKVQMRKLYNEECPVWKEIKYSIKLLHHQDVNFEDLERQYEAMVHS